MVNAQEYINQKYPVQEERAKTKELSIKNQSLEGELDLSDFINLKSLWCSNNKLTSINVSNCPHLEKIYCQNNQLTSLNTSNCYRLTELNCSNNLITIFALPRNPNNLKSLRLIDNNLGKLSDNLEIPLDLSFLVPYINLEILELGNTDKRKIERSVYNRFTGSLDFLSNMKELKRLDIRGTDINKIDFDKLPNSLEIICYLTKKGRVDCKLNEVISQLDKYYGKHGRCLNCLKPKTSENDVNFVQKKNDRRV